MNDPIVTVVLFILPVFNAVENLKVSNKAMNCVSLLQHARTMKDSEKRLNSQLRPILARQKLKRTKTLSE